MTRNSHSPRSRNWVRTVGTPATIATFVVAAASGLLLFFHAQADLVRQVHIWLGVAFVISSALHLVRNWRPFIGLARKPALPIAISIATAVTLAFMLSAANESGDRHGSMRAIWQALETTPLEKVSPLFGADPEELVALLQAAGLSVSGTTVSIAEVGKASGLPAREVMGVILAAH